MRSMRDDRPRPVEHESRDAVPDPHQGFARWQDVEDYASQAVAPPAHPTHWDRDGERRYEAGLRGFLAAQSRHSAAAWALDDGRIQFGRARHGFGGRGPRGYRRSDERVREDVCERLTEADDLDATTVDVAVRDGVVVLSGAVADRFSRRRAEDLAAGVAGVADVMNQLTVGAASLTGAG
ncbi:MAG: BON domain-containing protein [Deltaproteobacteria bacterium]|nr:BON domain-containing protein [Deltaproteobacteria bacterium]